MPFLGGKRVCIGKTFAENNFMVTLPLVLKAFKSFSFVDSANYSNKHPNNAFMRKRPVIEIIMDKN